MLTMLTTSISQTRTLVVHGAAPVHVAAPVQVPAAAVANLCMPVAAGAAARVATGPFAGTDAAAVATSKQRWVSPRVLGPTPWKPPA
ncbi:hypothetical protein CLV35_2765 [Motilibacter peucedani]|uniref:Uncharacterized protein n=1 Tax=Motilibacter peucedani TaxID=598650 RepID=A0A420XML5_9ACTN|nr:hypothetical protein CLV35_2765 [Motilibacter peucedani]